MAPLDCRQRILSSCYKVKRACVSKDFPRAGEHAGSAFGLISTRARLADTVSFTDYRPVTPRLKCTRLQDRNPKLSLWSDAGAGKLRHDISHDTCRSITVSRASASYSGLHISLGVTTKGNRAARGGGWVKHQPPVWAVRSQRPCSRCEEWHHRATWSNGARELSLR